MNLGIIGFGKHVEKNIINTLTNIKLIKLIFFFARKKNVSDIIAKKYSLKKINNINTFFDQDFDILYIACPPKKHEYYIELGLKNNKHVICEKPITLNHETNIKLYKIAHLKKNFLFEVCQYKYHNHFKKIKKIINNDIAINIKNNFFYSSFKIPLLPKNNFRLKKTNEDIIKYDIGFYPISLINELFNNIKIIDINRYKEDITYFTSVKFKAKSVNGIIEWGIGFQYLNQLNYFSKNLILNTENLFTKPIPFKPKIKISSKNKKDIILKSENHFENMFVEYFNIIIKKNIRKYNLIKFQTLSNSKLLSKI